MARTLAQRLVLTSCLGLLLQAACVCGPGPNQGGYDEPGAKDPPKSLQGIKFIESEKGDPATIGCADGQREGFADIQRHRRVAGCLATWEGTKSLRDKPTGKVCGDDVKGDAKKEPDKSVCTVPGDACAPGWHVCGMNGKNDDLKTHTTFKACNKEAGPGKFVAAISHGQSEELCPPAPTPDTIFPCMDSGYCAEPVCCGDGCQFGKCRDGVWKGQTRISLGKAEGCGSVTSERNGGVMCCYDKNEDPPGTAPGTTPPVTNPTDPAAATAGATPPPTDPAGGPIPTPSAPPTAIPPGTPGAAPTGLTGPTKSTTTPTKSTTTPTKSSAGPTKSTTTPDATKTADKKAG